MARRPCLQPGLLPFPRAFLRVGPDCRSQALTVPAAPQRGPMRGESQCRPASPAAGAKKVVQTDLDPQVSLEPWASPGKWPISLPLGQYLQRCPLPHPSRSLFRMAHSEPGCQKRASEQIPSCMFQTHCQAVTQPRASAPHP